MTKNLYVSLFVTLLLALCTSSVNAQDHPEVFADFTGSSVQVTGPEQFRVNNVILGVFIPNPTSPSLPPQQFTLAFNVVFAWDRNRLGLFPVSFEDPASGGDPGSGGCANLSVLATDALSRTPIPGATVRVGGAESATDANGLATFSGLPAGIVGMSINAQNYIAQSDRQIQLGCGENSYGISPRLAIDMNPSIISVILNWGENPTDLDAQLTAPNAINPQQRQHIFHEALRRDVAVLHGDTTQGRGPETITIFPAFGSTQLRPGVFRYFVRHAGGESTLSQSGASVNVIIGNDQFNYSIPDGCGTTGIGDIWTVFEINVSANGAANISPVNECWTGTDADIANR